MNKEYMILSDGKVAVSNENGNIEKRDFEDKYFVGETLTLENKLETINGKLEELNKKLKDEKGLMSFCKKMMKVQTFIIALITLGGFGLGGLFNASQFLAHGLYYGLLGLTYSSILASVPLIGCKIIKSKSSKKIIGLEGSIEEAQFQKLKYEGDLSIIKKIRVPQSKLQHRINEPISLETQNNFALGKIENDLNYAYESAIKNASKKLVLKK